MLEIVNDHVYVPLVSNAFLDVKMQMAKNNHCQWMEYLSIGAIF